MKKHLIPTLLLAVFEAVAVSLWLGKGKANCQVKCNTVS